MLFSRFKSYLGKICWNSLFNQKSDYLRKLVFLKIFLSTNHDKYFYMMETTLFVQSSEIGQILTRIDF